VRHARYLALLDALCYAVAVAAVAFAVSALGNAVLIRLSWFGVELLLFLTGWLVLAYGVAVSWPSSPWRVDRSEGRVRVDRSSEERGRTSFPGRESGLNRLVERALPLDGVDASDRVGLGPKLLAASALTLFLSYLVEVVMVSGR
jgi:hypothetical protein